MLVIQTLGRERLVRVSLLIRPYALFRARVVKTGTPPMKLIPPERAIRLSRQSADGTNVCFFIR